MKERGCYVDGQIQEIDAADTWACHARAGLNNAQKTDRECQSIEKLLRVTLMPPWELEETNKNWPKFKQRLLEFEVNQSEADLSTHSRFCPIQF
eukprot:1139588-Pelagomonas_calceolata.AAC.1